MERKVERKYIIFRIIIFITICGVMFLSNSLSVLADSSLNTQEKDPFFSEKIIDPSWGLWKSDSSWDPSQPWNHQILDDWTGSFRPQYIRGETWMGTQKYPDKDHVASTTIQYAVYRFNSELSAKQYLKHIFKKERILKVQESEDKFQKTRLLEINARLKKNIGPWKTYAMGGMAVPNSSDCQRDNYLQGYESFRVLSKKYHSYAINEYSYKSRLRFITEVNKTCREYRIITEGSIGEKFVSNEKRGIYIRKKEYILLVTLSASRMTTPWDAGISDGCNFRSTAKTIPFREDIWRQIMSLQGVSISNLSLDSDKDGVPDDKDCCRGSRGGNVDRFGCTPSQNLSTILSMYNNLDLTGKVYRKNSGLNGLKVNMFSWAPKLIPNFFKKKKITTFNGKPIYVQALYDGGIVCGSYQGGILDWLDAMRSSTAKYNKCRTYHDLFNGVEYGPIQSYGGAHQAVVIYPTGTSWKKTGIVLDPWYQQQTMTYPIGSWDVLAAPSSVYAGSYPITGKYAYQADIDYKSAIKHYQREQAKRTIRGELHCNMTLHITKIISQEQLRWDGNKLTNSIPNAGFSSHYLGNGDYLYRFQLPAGKYKIELGALKGGNFNFSIVYINRQIAIKYSKNAIKKGNLARTVIDSDHPNRSLVIDNGRKIIPTIVSQTHPQNTTTIKKRIYSVADAYVYGYSYRNWNRSNLGKYEQLRAGWHPVGGESRAYIGFYLSNVDPSNVNKAILRLYHLQTAGNDGVNLGVYRVTAPWKEGTDTYHAGRIERTAAPGELSWVQQPTFNPQPVATFNPGRGLNDWTEIDITPLVKKWLTGTPNYGLVIKPAGYLSGSTPVSVYMFASRERRSNLDKPKGKNKAPMLIISCRYNHQKQPKLSNGYLTIKDWDKTHEFFSFSLGRVVSKGTGDFFIANRGNSSIIHVFDSPGIIDMGNVAFDYIKRAPATGYKEVAKPIKWHSYIIRSRGKYGKIRIENIIMPPISMVAEYKIRWAYLPGTAKNYTKMDSGTKIKTTTTNQYSRKHQPGFTKNNGMDKASLYRRYIQTYQRLQRLMKAGRGDTPEAQKAYREYKKAKDAYEKAIRIK